MFSDVFIKWLDSALDYGISEAEFWDMTIAELEREIASRKRRMVREAQEKASADYILADLIGRSIARIYHSSNTMPEIGTIYPNLFDSKDIQERKQQRQAELSALRFKKFASSFNTNFKKREEAKKLE